MLRFCWQGLPSIGDCGRHMETESSQYVCGTHWNVEPFPHVRYRSLFLHIIAHISNELVVVVDRICAAASTGTNCLPELRKVI